MSATARSVQTTMSPPPLLGLPPRWPAIAAGCQVCAALARQRAEAAKAGDMSRVSDCNVEIRNHQHDTPEPS